MTPALRARPAHQPRSPAEPGLEAAVLDVLRATRRDVVRAAAGTRADVDAALRAYVRAMRFAGFTAPSIAGLAFAAVEAGTHAVRGARRREARDAALRGWWERSHVLAGTACVPACPASLRTPEGGRSGGRGRRSPHPT